MVLDPSPPPLVEWWSIIVTSANLVSKSKNLCSQYPITKACAIEAVITWLACYLHSAGAVLRNIFKKKNVKKMFSPLKGMTQTSLWTIRQHSYTGEQICNCKSSGVSGQNFRRCRFFSRYRIVGVRFTKTVESCPAKGEMVGKTGRQDSRQDSPC